MSMIGVRFAHALPGSGPAAAEGRLIDGFLALTHSEALKDHW